MNAAVIAILAVGGAAFFLAASTFAIQLLQRSYNEPQSDQGVRLTAISDYGDRIVLDGYVGTTDQITALNEAISDLLARRRAGVKRRRRTVYALTWSAVGVPIGGVTGTLIAVYNHAVLFGSLLGFAGAVVGGVIGWVLGRRRARRRWPDTPGSTVQPGDHL
jgi:hypothetical protein